MKKAKGPVRRAILLEQRYADKRIADAVRQSDRVTEAFFNGYRNGLGFAHRCIIDSEQPAAGPLE